MKKCLAIFAIAIISSGCCHNLPPHVPAELPPRPVLGEYSTELWFSLPEEARLIIVDDDLAVKKYIRQTEQRIRIHNGDGRTD